MAARGRAVQQEGADLVREPLALRAFVGRGRLENFEAKEMLGYKHSGFSVDAGVCIEAHDRAALERLLRYCARPPFSAPTQRGKQTGVPLCQTAQRAHQ